jgi:hypothetical protein
MIVNDNTARAAFSSCPRSYQYFIREHLQPKRVAAPLNFGAAVHAGIAHFTRAWHKTEYTKDAKVLEEMKNAAMAEAVTGWREQEMSEKEWRTPEKLVVVLAALIDWKITENARPYVLHGGPVVERSFSDDSFSADYTFCGKIDELQVCYGTVTVMDYKTTSNLRGDKRKGEAKYIPAEFWEQFRLSAAMHGYAFAASKLVGARVPQIAIVGIGIDKSVGGGVVIEKQIFQVNVEQLEEWTRDYRHWIKLMQICEEEAYFPKNPDACFSYMRRCKYHSICMTNCSARAGVKEQMEQRPWNPLALEEED